MMRGVARMAAIVLGAFAAWPAQAHLVESGFGAFYDGIAHVALTASDLLVVIALALLAGQRGSRTARWTLLLLPLAWIAGGALGAAWPAQVTLPVSTTLTFGVAGALVALNASLPVTAISLYAIAAGLLHGYVNGATMMPAGSSALAVTGATTAVFCIVAILGARVTALRAGWALIAVRVTGSWIAAAAILMLGWQARLGGW